MHALREALAFCPRQVKVVERQRHDAPAAGPQLLAEATSQSGLARAGGAADRNERNRTRVTQPTCGKGGHCIAEPAAHAAKAAEAPRVGLPNWTPSTMASTPRRAPPVSSPEPACRPRAPALGPREPPGRLDVTHSTTRV